MLHLVGFSIFILLSDTFLILRTERDMITNALFFFMSSTRHPCPILIKLEFSDSFSKNTQISNFRKIRLVGAGFPMRADGRWTDRHDVANCPLFRNFANSPRTFRLYIYIYVLCGSQNKQRLCPYKALTGRF